MNLLDIPDWLAPLVRRSRSVHYEAGDVLIHQGDGPAEINVVTSGRAKAIAYSQSGHETWLCEFVSGDLLGHIGILNSEPSYFEVVAETDMTVFTLSGSALRRQLDTDAATGGAIAEELSGRLKLMMTRYIEAVTLSAKGRVCAELLRLAETIGVQPDNMAIRPNPVFVDVALRIGSTRETVSRTVSELLKKEIVKREAGALLICKPGALKSAMR